MTHDGRNIAFFSLASLDDTSTSTTTPACPLGTPHPVRIEELLDARAATPGELLQTSPFDVPGAIAVSRRCL